MLLHQRDIDPSRIKELKKLSLQLVPMLPDDRQEAEYVLGLVWVHLAFLNEDKLPGNTDELPLDPRVLEFKRAGRADR